MKNFIKSKIKKGSKSVILITSTLYNLFSNNKIRIRGIQNCIEYKGNYLKKCKISVYGDRNKIYIDPMGLNQLCNTSIKIYGNDNSIIIGKRNTIFNGDLHIEDNNNEILFKDHNSILGFTHIAVTEGQSIQFGTGCLFSTDVTFRTGDSHSIIDLNSKERINQAKSIKIGDRVWFGNKTIILKGTNIGNDIVIATGSIVTKSFNENNIVLAGNPAQVIKKNIVWMSERI